MSKIKFMFTVSIFKTIYYNFKFLNLKQALHLPILIFKNVKIIGKGKILLNKKEKFGSISIGKYNQHHCTKIYFESNLGEIYFSSGVNIDGGTSLNIWRNSKLKLGSNVTININTVIDCTTSIVVGDNTAISAECYIMDTDWHTIGFDNGKFNLNEKIIIENNVWIGLRTTVLKGSIIPRETVVGANSLVAKKYNESNTVIGGNPARIIKKNIKWDRAFPKVKSSN